MSFALFIVLNGIVLIRPEDMLPDLAGTRLYLYVIIFCILTALPKLAAKLSISELVKQPITVCVLGLLFATAASLLAHGYAEAAVDFVPEFAKTVIYYLLLCALVDSPQRFRIFLSWQVVFITILATIAVLEFHEYLQFDTIKPVYQEVFDGNTGQWVKIPRMCSAGIFNDPNDLCLVLVFGILCSMYHAATAANWFFTVLCALPSALFGYSLVLTQSRGGLLGLLAAAATFVSCKYGWRRAFPLLAVCLPAAVLAMGGRQAEIGVGSDTAHERITYWAEGFSEISRSPFQILFGIGAGGYEGLAGHVAHNSYVHAYVELGLLGGTLFLGAFTSAVWLLAKLGKDSLTGLPRSLRVAWPFVMAMVVGYMAGVFSLSRNYVVPTYLCLGLASCYSSMAMPEPPHEACVSNLWLTRLAMVGVGSLVFLKFFTQFAGSLGV